MSTNDYDPIFTKYRTVYEKSARDQQKLIVIITVVLFTLAFVHFDSIAGNYESKWLTPYVVYATIPCIFIYTWRLNNRDNSLVLLMDEHAFKRYFFNIHTNNPEGEGIIKRFLSLARDIDPKNNDFVDNYSKETLDDGTELDAHIRISNKTESKSKIFQDPLEYKDRSNWWHQWLNRPLRRYFIVKYYDTFTFDELKKLVNSVTTHYKKTDQIYRLVIISENFSDDFSIDNTNLSEEIRNIIKVKVGKETKNLPLDLVKKYDENFRFLWSTILD